ncbi:MAG: hypothetical protein JOY99_03970 [Sphingomonadaceae bacterium]|nr:hypothetical protein [Sphingomonadaceae bacterium]
MSASDTDTKQPGASGGAASGTRSSGQGASSSHYADALDRGADALDGVREQTGAALETVREAAANVTERATREIAENPVAALLGGLAIGAIAGALIPKSRAEVEALSGLALGERASAAARAAADAARSTGRESLGDFVLNRDTSMNEAVAKLIEAAFAAATSAGGAAFKSARGGE